MSEASENESVGNVHSDTRRCWPLKSSTGEEGGSYDVRIEIRDGHADAENARMFANICGYAHCQNMGLSKILKNISR